jgi:hypothetical protein
LSVFRQSPDEVTEAEEAEFPIIVTEEADHRKNKAQ